MLCYKNRDIGGVIFDMDGTLIDSLSSYHVYLNKSLEGIGLATGRTSGAVYEWERLKNLGLDNFIDAIVTAAEVGNRKPAPDLITECARKMGVEARRCVVVGDSVSDILAAKNAGAIPVAVCTGVDNSDKLNEQGPEAILETLDKLVGLLESRPGKG